MEKYIVSRNDTVLTGDPRLDPIEQDFILGDNVIVKNDIFSPKDFFVFFKPSLSLEKNPIISPIQHCLFL